MIKRNKREVIENLPKIKKEKSTTCENGVIELVETVETIENDIKESEENSFIIFVDEQNKTKKKPIQLLVDPDLIERVDKLAKQAKKSRNEVISMMMEDCLSRVKVKKCK